MYIIYLQGTKYDKKNFESIFIPMLAHELFTLAVSIIISRVFSDFHRKQLKKSRHVWFTPVFIEAARQNSGIRFNLDNNLDRRTRNKNTRLDRTRKLWRRHIKIVCNFVSDCAVRDTLYKPFAFRFVRIINFFRKDYHSIQKQSLVKHNN